MSSMNATVEDSSRMARGLWCMHAYPFLEYSDVERGTASRYQVA